MRFMRIWEGNAKGKREVLKKKFPEIVGDAKGKDREKDIDITSDTDRYINREYNIDRDK